jgi:hypothetical protein
MKPRKKKTPSKTMRPSRESVWRRATGRFQLTPEEQAMAKTAGFTPTLMDEVATGRRIKRSVHDKLPKHAMPGQIERVKREIRERHAAKTAAESTPAAAPSPATRSARRLRLTHRADKERPRMSKKKEQRKRNHRWKLMGKVFHLSPEQVQMVKLLGADPGTTLDRWRDRAQERGLTLAAYVERRYVAQYGNADPMRCTPGQRNRKQKRLAAQGVTKHRIMIPIELSKRMKSQCELRGLKFAEGIQAALEAYFPAPPEEQAA